MSNRASAVGLMLLAAVVAGLACRWEAWDYRGADGAAVFRYRGVLLPWQEPQGPPPGLAVSSVTVQKWSYYGLNRSDYTGAPGRPSGPPAK